MLSTDRTGTTFVSLPLVPMTEEAACRRAEGFASIDPTDEAANVYAGSSRRHGPMQIIGIAFGVWALIGVAFYVLIALAARWIP